LKTEKINRQKLFFAALSGMLLTLSFPKAGLFWLAWFALVPLLVALRNLSLKDGFILGFCAGLAHYLTLVYWLANTMNTYGHLPMYLCLPALLLLSAILALYVAVFSMFVSRLCPTPFTCFATTPFVWVALEYMRTLLFTGFPWELLGYSQFKVLPLIQIADMFGVYGVSFCVALGNAALFMVFLALTKKDWRARMVTGRLAAGSLFTFILIFGLVWFYGTWRIQAVDAVSSKAPVARIAIIQGNIDQTIKWDPAFQQASTQKYINLSMQSKADRPDLVVWPETATPFYFLHHNKLSQLVIKGVQDTGADLLFGSPSFRPGKNGVAHYNSAYLIGPEPKVYGRYDKAHLVPFGEYIPLHKWLPFLNKMVEGVGDFRPGKPGQTIGWKDYNIGIQICYEIIFPKLSRLMAQNNAALLVNITNDAWYGKSSAPYQHFSMAIFRAVENRRALIRAANTGISGFIDPAGRVIASTKLFEDAFITRPMPMLHISTWYSSTGDLFAILCLAATLAAAIYSIVRHRNASRHSKQINQ
jgi:apolipoprotein N-acyltransferase